MRDSVSWCGLAGLGKLRASPRFAPPCDPGTTSAWWRHPAARTDAG
jgi:hypothetical protein